MRLGLFMMPVHPPGCVLADTLAEDEEKKTRGAFTTAIIVKEDGVLGRPGSVLLFQALRLSTIGAEDFDGRVRNGIG